MSESLLLKVGDSVKQYANVISSVLNVDVDIADSNLVRVAGTGKFERSINMHFINEGNAFKRVLQTKKHLFIENAREHELCVDCKNLEICRDQCELCCPIIVKNEVIGVISLASSNDNQKRQLSENTSKYLAFLENIADLISSKAIEYQNYEEISLILELLYKLMNLINDGVIVFDANNNILYMNRKTELLFGNNVSQLKYLHKIKQFSIQKVKNERIPEGVEYIARVKERKIKLLGRNYPINIMSKEMSQVFIFQDVETLQQNLLQVSRTENYNFNYLIGKDDNFLKVKEQCEILASSDTNLLIYGETGTGKEMFARAIHNESMRRSKPFITVTCSGAVDTILEQEILGNNFQATEDNGIGKVALSNGGTLFLDGISDLSLRLQGKLVNIINQPDINIRIIATTNKNLNDMIQHGEFREDLYYSLETFTITIPPLRSRKEDIILLTNYFLEKYNHLEGKDIKFKKDIYNIFMKYSWPGNVRELENIVSFIILSYNSDKIISIDDLPIGIQNKLINETTGQFNLEKIEQQTILNALNTFGNSAETKKYIIKELGISKATFYRKLQKYSIVETVHFNTESKS